MSKAPKCPNCGKPADPKFRPFCSKHCADVDLGRWLGGVYVVPGDEAIPTAGTGAFEDDGEE